MLDVRQRTTYGHGPMAPKPLLDVAGVAERLGTTERHVRQLRADMRIPFVKVGRALRFDPDAIDQWVEENRSEVVA